MCDVVATSMRGRGWRRCNRGVGEGRGWDRQRQGAGARTTIYGNCLMYHICII